MSRPLGRRRAAALACAVALSVFFPAADAAIVTGAKKIKHPSSGLVLGTMDDGPPYPGTYVMLRPDTGHKTQKWTLRRRRGGADPQPGGAQRVHQPRRLGPADDRAVLHGGRERVAVAERARRRRLPREDRLGLAPGGVPRRPTRPSTSTPRRLYDAQYRWVFASLPTAPRRPSRIRGRRSATPSRRCRSAIRDQSPGVSSATRRRGPPCAPRRRHDTARTPPGGAARTPRRGRSGAAGIAGRRPPPGIRGSSARRGSRGRAARGT